MPVEPHFTLEESTIDNTLVMLVVMDEHEKIIRWNRAAELITGYGKGEVLGSSAIWDSLCPDKPSRGAFTRQIHEIFNSQGDFEDFEAAIVTRGGDVRTISWNIHQLVQDGRVQIIAAGVDITRRCEAEKDARRLNAFLESVIENAIVLLVVVDAAGRVIIWNKAAEDITGYTRKEVVGSVDIWHRLSSDPSYFDAIFSKINSLLASTDYVENLETNIVTKDGGIREISWNMQEISPGDDIMAVIIGRDVTEQRKAEQALVAYVSEMAMRITHPLAIIRENLADTRRLLLEGKISPGEAALMLDCQISNAARVAANVEEIQKAIVERSDAIPEAYRLFLSE